MAETKVCTVCGKEKPLIMFHRNRLARDGRKNVCGVCRAGTRKDRQNRGLGCGTPFRETNANLAEIRANYLKVRAEKIQHEDELRARFARATEEWERNQLACELGIVRAKVTEESPHLHRTRFLVSNVHAFQYDGSYRDSCYE